MSILNTAISKYYSQTIGKTLHNLTLATSTHAEWILRHHRRKRTQTWNEGLTSAIFYPQQAGKTQIIGHIQRVNLSTTFHYLEYACIFVHFTKVKLSYICTQKLNGWQVFVNIYCNTFVESTLPSRYRTLIDWLIDWLIDCLVDCMMLRVVEHNVLSCFVLWFLCERLGMVIKSVSEILV